MVSDLPTPALPLDGESDSQGALSLALHSSLACPSFVTTSDLDAGSLPPSTAVKDRLDGLRSISGVGGGPTLSDTGTLYKEDGKERQEFFEAGDVFWRDKIVHDHKSIAAGSAILITVK